MSETQFVKGMYVNRPHENAPDFVKCCVSFHKDNMIEELQSMQASEKGYVNCDIKVSKDGKLYPAWNNFKGGAKKTQPDEDDMPPF